MLASARKLAAAGADFLICPDNTIHQALPLVRAALAAALAAHRRGGRRAGAASAASGASASPARATSSRARCTRRSSAARGLGYLRPNADEREEINRIIFEELVRGIFTPAAVGTSSRCSARMQAAGCDAVVLGCTEIPLLMNDANSPLPTLDSTRLLARAALAQAVADASVG